MWYQLGEDAPESVVRTTVDAAERMAAAVAAATEALTSERLQQLFLIKQGGRTHVSSTASIWRHPASRMRRARLRTSAGEKSASVRDAGQGPSAASSCVSAKVQHVRLIC